MKKIKKEKTAVNKKGPGKKKEASVNTLKARPPKKASGPKAKENKSLPRKKETAGKEKPVSLKHRVLKDKKPQAQQAAVSESLREGMVKHPSAVPLKAINAEEGVKKPVIKIETAETPVERKPSLPVSPKPKLKREASGVSQPSSLAIPPVEAGPKASDKPAVVLKPLELELPITVKDLAVRLQDKPSFLIKNLMGIGLMVGINQLLDEPTAAKVCQKYGYEVKKALSQEEVALFVHQEQDEKALLKPRTPVVTFMGHVDHGKTSLLDAIRKTKVTESEHGGITQHIGAYRVSLPQGNITFLDTPGHEAFTAMRARGASITDIVVLVVAADDGIMPQTQEAIDHARAAGVPIIVAINKIDKPQADINKVKKQLAAVNLTAEDWGGKTITVLVSAKTSEGIDNLLEMIILESQMLELKANPERQAKGVVIEAKLTPGRGPVATLLVQNGTLHLNENIIVGKYYGKIRAMQNYLGQAIVKAPPSYPVEVSGLGGVPQTGEQFYVIGDEKTARQLAQQRQEEEKQQQLKSVKRISLEDLHIQIKEGRLKELKLIIKADVQGSLEAIKEVLGKINVTEIKIVIIHEGVGSVNSSDVVLAAASDALVMGFNVAVEDPARIIVSREGIDVRTYNIIYELANDIKAALEGILEPKIKKIFLGRVEVRKVFNLSRSGLVAGCFVTKGRIARSDVLSLIRNGSEIFEGKLSSLKRFKDDVRDVQEGFDCGLTIAGFADLQVGDVIEAYAIEKIARKL
ncbi:MAG: translation initiation factor IF-2 [Candidatus Omnitrophota bacterium]